MSQIRTTRRKVTQWFEFLAALEKGFLPRFNLMIGYAYGYAEGALAAGREDLAAPKVEWLMLTARKHGALLVDDAATEAVLDKESA